MAEHSLSPRPTGAPRVTVIVPNYNHARFLRQRLDSILGQTHQDFELLILDDASTDRSAKVIRSYLNQPHVRFVANARNSGSAFRQWAKGLALARGEYIWLAESDDWADPRFLERLLPVLEESPRLGLVYCQSRCVDAAGKILGDASGWTADLDPLRWTTDFCNAGSDELRRFLLRKNTLPSASAVLCRRSALQAAGVPDADLRLCGDWLTWMRLLSAWDVAFVAEPLNYWRQRTSHARLPSNGTLEWLEGERVLTEGCRLAGLSRAETTGVLFDFLKRCWQWQREYIEAVSGGKRTSLKKKLGGWLKRAKANRA